MTKIEVTEIPSQHYAVWLFPGKDSVIFQRIQVWEWKPFRYSCSVCHKPNNYWWLYCRNHEHFVDQEMDWGRAWDDVI